MTLIEQNKVFSNNFVALYSFPVTVSGGVGIYVFPIPITGKLYHRQISPPNGAGSYSCYFQNNLSMAHDVHTGTGAVQNFDDLALLVNEYQFDIVNAETDGVYTIALWVLSS